MSTHNNEAKQLVESLYEQGSDLDANWDNIDDQALQQLREAHESGDEAVQNLLATLAFNKFETAEQADRIAVSLSGIKRQMVSQIFEEFPTTSLEELRAAAEKAGYDVEVIA